jgi:hypothetical protein
MLLIVTLGGPVYRLVNTSPSFGAYSISGDSQGNIYYSFPDRIEKRTNTGELVLRINFSFNAESIHIDALQNIYIYGVGGQFILEKYNAVGALIYSKSGPEFINLQMTTDASQNLYIYSFLSGSSPIRKYSSTGTLLATFNGIIPGQSGVFGTVAVDSAGNIYVLNANNFNIKKYSSNGVFQANVDLPPTTSIFIDSNDNFYLNTVFSNFIKYSPSFDELGTIFLRSDEDLSETPRVNRNGEFVYVTNVQSMKFNTYRLI